MVLLLTKLRRSGWFSLPAFLAAIFVLGLLLTFLHNRNYNRAQLDGDEVKKSELGRGSRRVNDVNEPPTWNCTKQVTLLTPSMGPFKAWREYKLLQHMFTSNIKNCVPCFELSCPVQRCNLTIGATLSDKRLLGNSDGVVINIAPNLLKNKLDATIKKLSNILRDDVTWFFLGMESPQMFTYWDAQISNIQYHNEIAYHSHSSLSIPYGHFVASKPMDTVPGNDWTKDKTHLIAWMASNCENTFWPRSEFVHDLLNYIPVDMYGKCGNLSCLPPMSPECNNMLSKYKFYLALENTECDEYITEKFWENCMKHNVVPVVYGGRKAAYKKLAPPNSFIHVGDFATAEELAQYLLALDRDDQKYNEFFQWRLKGHVQTNYPPLNPDVFCEMIPLLSSETPKTKQKVSESKYFNSCRDKPTGLFAKVGSYSNWSPWK
ncbi:4-galactosyl-N-acetylglucosaminide 3-alpha-L-fucosyltransferase FUT6-like [Amphiura filiformis]|uniref:4-galactosyl-N-acetylglucosaminide 3-alpha-L-fucosyltransferase FUT6-like n=1 Tax=Amphiura filiformis TaxID=82378 RepID=UPI003B21A8C9